MENNKNIHPSIHSIFIIINHLYRILDPILQRAMLLDQLAMHPIRHNASLFAVFLVDFPVELGEAPFAWNDNVLAAREFEFGTAEGLQCMSLMLEKWILWIDEVNLQIYLCPEFAKIKVQGPGPFSQHFRKHFW